MSPPLRTNHLAWVCLLCRARHKRHTAVTNVYRKSRDLFLAQRFARHVSPLTTTVYTHPSDDEMFSKIRSLSC